MKIDEKYFDNDRNSNVTVTFYPGLNENRAKIGTKIGPKNWHTITYLTRSQQ